MLVLSRRLGEEITIDGNIRVTIVSVKRGQIRLGFTAPDSVKIVRQEFTGSPPNFACDKTKVRRLAALRR